MTIKLDYWVTVDKDDYRVSAMLDSEISHPEADDIERKIIVGMAHYIKSLTPKE